MEGQRIPTLDNPERVELKGGGEVIVRRMKATVNAQLMDKAGFNNKDDPAGAIRFGVKSLQWGIVGAKDITNADGKPVEYEDSKTRGITGRLCTEELAETIQQNSEEDFELLMAIIHGDKAAGLTEKDEGNSESSQHGSIDSE